MSRKKRELWIGSAHVKQPHRNGTLGDADEAYVNVIALAADRSGFRRQVKKEVESLGLMLLRLKDGETLERRLSRHSIHQDLSRLSQEVQRTGQVAFDVFCTFDHGT
jgi:hypothetical protein